MRTEIIVGLALGLSTHCCSSVVHAQTHRQPQTEAPSLTDATPQSKTGKVTGSISTTRVRTKGPTSQRDLVVYLVPAEPPPAPLTEPAREVTPNADSEKVAHTYQVTQRNLNFEPHVVVARVGSTLEFHNEDRVRHNVTTESKCCEVDSDMDTGAQESKKLLKPGVAEIRCRIHPEMQLFVLVLENDLFTQTEIERKRVDGKRRYLANYTIDAVPPGKYLLKTWNKTLQTVETPIEVEAGKTLRLDLELAQPPR